MGSQRFRAVVAAGSGDGAVITVPFDPDEAWGAVTPSLKRALTPPRARQNRWPSRSTTPSGQSCGPIFFTIRAPVSSATREMVTGSRPARFWSTGGPYRPLDWH
jgi:hypothetical protein